MIVLHAAWREPDGIHVWGETDEPGAGMASSAGPAGHALPLATPGTAKTGSVRPAVRPFAAPAAVTKKALVEVLPDGASRLFRDSSERLELPGRNGGPAASRPGLDPIPGDEPAGTGTGGTAAEIRIMPWQVPGIFCPAGDSPDWLVALPRRGEEPAGIAVGDDLRWFSEAAKLVLETVARERFVPTAPRRGEAGVEARWEPLLSAPGVLERIALLARCMPEACRAIPEARPPRDSLVRHFLRAGVDGFVRRVHLRPVSGGSPADRWLGALGDGKGAGAGGTNAPPASLAVESARPWFIPGEKGELTHLSIAVTAWVAPVLSAEPFEGFRTCFRLEPPRPAPADPGKSADGGGEDGKKRLWRLRFLLQPVEDPSAMIPAAALWRSSSPLPPDRRAKAQDRLLADLARARRLFAPVGRALMSRRPRFVQLSVHEAHRFLREAAPLLNEGGAGVITPPWWAAGKANLTARAVIRPAPESPGMMGLEALVDFDLHLALGGIELAKAELERLVALKLPLVQMRGQWVEMRPEDAQAALKLLNRRSARMTLREALAAGGDDGETDRLAISEVSASGWVRDLLSAFKGDRKIAPVPVPAEFRGRLRPYQERGLAWLDFLRRHGLGGCLADDMGLGKTVQALALLVVNAKRNKDRGVAKGNACVADATPGAAKAAGVAKGNACVASLLVCPTSVLGNWAREAARFAPSLKVMLHHGPGRAGGTAFDKAAAASDLVVTSYALLHRDRERLAKRTWDTVLLDEAQNVKNPRSKQAVAAREIKARHRIGLTGTPVENHLTDLWSILHFLNPGHLGTLDTFRVKLAIPVERWHSDEHALKLRRLVAPFILRRLKTDPGIAPELPPRIETRELCRLTREQGTLYAAVVNDMMARIEDTEGIQRKGIILSALTRLKQVCDHPALLLKDRSALAGRSGKLARAEEILEEIIEEGQRALVFTQFAEMGALLHRHLSGRFNSEILFLHGGTPRLERERLIARFQDPASSATVFVLSLKAGGTGLNLTAASHVIHFDRWWNPAVENQATDRAHRIGQTRAVQVHKFVCQGTLEERIEALIESKKDLAARVVGSGEAWITGLSTASLRDLFTLRADALEDDK
jgi:superfamily II DNA or RNA helicase